MAYRLQKLQLLRSHLAPRAVVRTRMTLAPVRAEASSMVKTSVEHAAEKKWEIRMLFDGECPICMVEVNMLRERDAGKGKIDFVDIAAPDYSPAENQNIDFEQAMGRIHAILPDGTIVTDVEVFRRLYEAVGLGHVYAFTKSEPWGSMADALYKVWAKFRTQITGREPLAVILAKRRAKAAEGCVGADCSVPNPSGQSTST